VTLVLVLVGGALGAPLRYLADLAVRSRHDSVFPWGTFAVNVVGSLILGVAAGAVTATDGPAWVLTLLGTGFCGALTTFSAFGFETVRLLEEGSLLAAGLNVCASLVVGMAACAFGFYVATALA
jgi:CrcB protein